MSLCAAKSVLFVSLVDGVLQSKVYAAKEVGYSYSLSPSPNGLTLSFSGLSDPAIFRKFISTVAGGECLSALEKVPIDMGLDRHRNCQSCSAYTSSIRPFESVVGRTLELLNLTFSAILLRRRLPIGDVHRK